MHPHKRTAGHYEANLFLTGYCRLEGRSKLMYPALNRSLFTMYFELLLPYIAERMQGTYL